MANETSAAEKAVLGPFMDELREPDPAGYLIWAGAGLSWFAAVLATTVALRKLAPRPLPRRRGMARAPKAADRGWPRGNGAQRRARSMATALARHRGRGWIPGPDRKADLRFQMRVPRAPSTGA